MNCRNCGLIIDNNSNFCPYCGTKIEDGKSYTYEDPFKDLRIDNTHGGQYQYQQDYSNKKGNLYDDGLNIDKKKKTGINISLVGLILGFISIFISFFVNVNGLGLGLGILALILVIFGFKKASRRLAVISLVFTILNFITNVFITIIMFIFSFTFIFQNGQEVTIKDYFTDAFFCGFNENRIVGSWGDIGNKFLYLSEDGEYKFYIDSSNYYFGDYVIESGVDLGDDEIIYGDEDYYYYQIDMLSNKMMFNGKIYDTTIDFIEEIEVIKLDKDSKDILILKSDLLEYKFERE